MLSSHAWVGYLPFALLLIFLSVFLSVPSSLPVSSHLSSSLLLLWLLLALEEDGLIELDDWNGSRITDISKRSARATQFTPLWFLVPDCPSIYLLVD